MPEDKVKAQFERVEVSSGLSIDSPMVIFRTDLEALGLTGGGGSSGGKGSPGGDVASGGATSGLTTVPSESTTSTARVAETLCAAMCDRHHEAGSVQTGVIEQASGVWFGVCSSDLSEARNSAQAHEDGFAFVAVYVDGVLVGPVSS